MASVPVKHVISASDNNASDDDTFSVVHHPSSRPSSVMGDEPKAEGDRMAESTILDADQPVAPPPEEAAAGQDGPAADGSTARAAMYHDKLDKLLGILEKELDKSERGSRCPSSASSSSVSISDYDYDSDSDGGPRIGRRRPVPRPPQLRRVPLLVTRRMISEARECDWERFMNRFSVDEPLYAVDVLVADQQLQQAVLNECNKRSRHAYLNGIRPPTPRQIYKLDNGGPWIHRIRIQSKALLGVFSRVTGIEWQKKPYTFVRPFQYLVHNHDKFRAELERLERLESGRDAVTGILPVVPEQETDTGPPAGVITPMNSTAYHDPRPQAAAELEDLRCYIRFIEARLVPEMERCRPETYADGLKVRFDDLWYLFTPGDLMYVPQANPASTTAGRSHIIAQPQRTLGEVAIRQSIWRLILTRVPAADPAPGKLETSGRVFQAQCYYIDYDGAGYAAANTRFRIPHFDGEMDVRDLPVYPLRYAPGADALLREAIETGRRYANAVARRHFTCSGVAIVTNAVGAPAGPRPLPGPPPVQALMRVPQMIRGEVIVDFKEALVAMPSHRISLDDWGRMAERESVGGVVDNPHRVAVWGDAARSWLTPGAAEPLVTDDSREAADHNAAIEAVPYLRAATRPAAVVRDEDLALLPPRVFVYSLGQRRFAAVSPRCLFPLSPVVDAALVPDGSDHQWVVQSVVREHLRRRRVERCQGGELERDEGRGTYVLLHGEPGTDLAETPKAVARSTGRPLFRVRCCDIIRGAPNPEERLAEVLRLSRLWDCVLFLEQVEAFLYLASEDTWPPNHLSCYFSSHLESYNGLVFLGTNRIRKLDPALTSSMHLVLHCKCPAAAEVEDRFRHCAVHLEKVEAQQAAVTGDAPLTVDAADVVRFAADHYSRFPGGKGAWNRQQINNAFDVAAALAHDEAAATLGAAPRLRYRHLAEVERLSIEFDLFRTAGSGGDGSAKEVVLQERDEDRKVERGGGREAELQRSLDAAQRALAAVVKAAIDKDREGK